VVVTRLSTSRSGRSIESSAEDTLAGAQDERVDHQLELIDQAKLDECVSEHSAADHDFRADAGLSYSVRTSGSQLPGGRANGAPAGGAQEHAASGSTMMMITMPNARKWGYITLISGASCSRLLRNLD
jgi:hypothetical protein